MVGIDVNIDIDQLDALVDFLGGLPQAVEAVVPLVAERTYMRIAELAGEELHTSYATYMQALQLDTSTNEITLDASQPSTQLAWIIEHGTGGFDMKESLGPGEHRFIPFAHTPPGSASSKGQPMGSGYKHFGWWAKYANQLSKETYGAAKKQGPKDRFNALHQPTAKVYHKYPLYHDMQRKTSGPKGGRANYVTFRTMSENSDGWLYPAMAGHHFFQRVAPTDIANFVDQAVEAILSRR